MTGTRLALTNRASQRMVLLLHAAGELDVDTMADCYVKDFVFEDRRRSSVRPMSDLNCAGEHILSQYSRFEVGTLAVRGQRVHLSRMCLSNDSGSETSYLIVHEIDPTGRFAYEGRFDENNFDAAYRMLEERYYSDEGASLRAGATALTESALAMDPPDLRSMVVKARAWFSAFYRWSPTVIVARQEREAFGSDGEHYRWSSLKVVEIQDGRIDRTSLFELDDEAAAFAYAEEQVRRDEQR